MGKTTKLFDAIVVGGGPAGSMTGYRLAKSGMHVAIIEAKRFPRTKPCGGGIQERALRRIPVDWQNVVRGNLCDVSLSFGLHERVTKSYPQPLVHTVLRAEFDQCLLDAAKKAGVDVHEGTRVRSVLLDCGEGVCVETDRGLFAGRVLVGADGANSLVSGVLNKRRDYFWQAGLYCEVEEEWVDTSRIDYRSMRIDWGTLPSGYAWVFPKRGYVNIGVGCPASMARLLRPYLRNFLENERILKPGARERLEFKGHQLPTLSSKIKLASERVLLVGDAAGLVEPLTGDGISYACHSATIAAEIILQNRNKARPNLTPYEGHVRDEIVTEILWSRKLLSLAVTFPRVVFRLVRSNERVWQTLCRVLRGEDSFRGLTCAILGSSRFLGALRQRFLPADIKLSQIEARELGCLGGTDN